MDKARQITGSLNRRYSLALALIASLAIGTFVALQFTLKGEEKRTQIVSLTSGQRALSQRIAFFANAYAVSIDLGDFG